MNTDTGFAPVYLFLDFDGVLHRDDESAHPFEHADRLGLLLRDYPEVIVIVSSTWGKTRSLDELQKRCGPNLGPLLCGVTPTVKLVLGGRPAFHRFREIAFWLATHPAPVADLPDKAAAALVRRDWIALDDSESWFPPACLQLIHVAGGRGLDETHFAEIKDRLVTHRGTAA